MGKKKGREKNKIIVWVEFIPFWLLCSFIRMLPLKTAFALAKFLFRILFTVDLRHRNRAIRHLLHAGVAKDKNEARAIALKSFLHFSMLLVEIAKMDQEFKLDKVKVTGNPDSIRELFKSGDKNQNVILVTAHYGNWEMAGSAWAMQTGIPMVSIMRPFGNPLIGEYILRSRVSDVHSMVDKEGGIRGLLKALKERKTISILADQHAGRKEGIETIFFGQPCRTYSSPAQLHLKTGVPIITELNRRVDDNFNFEFVLGKVIRYQPTGDKEKDVKEVVQLYTTGLEELIKEQPEQWLWAHRRWRNIVT